MLGRGSRSPLASDATRPLRILLLEDDPGYARLVKEYLRTDELGPHELHTASTLAGALAAVRARMPDVVIADLGLPDAVGDEVVTALREVSQRVPIVILSGHYDIEKALDTIQDGAQEYLVKGRCEDFFLVRSIRAAIERKRFEEYEQLLVGIVSHDLRAPLQAIRGAIDLLAVESGASDVLALADQALDRAVRLTGDLLDFTKLRLHGLLPITTAPADLHECVCSVVEELRLTSSDRVIALRTDGDTRLALDVDRMSQVVANLLENALHHSPPGSPVGVACRGTDDAVTVTFTNGGAPIPAAAQARLFQPLERLGAGTRRGSIGLGLYITEQIVRAHGGSISVTSSDAEGTAFCVALPRSSADAPADGRAGADDAARPRGDEEEPS